ncbi:hypothetical protein PAPYR_10791 [Paratrimastix pyriformis]|uniref:Uncharacterized protein n=1 Tax=Paratrimastix pyriformis TaxID=342808 RepID=A0ABQ8U557_9EUKA|nr:hypothetical protein PAPYR_10791 [Paratrimastix pyriformis]
MNDSDTLGADLAKLFQANLAAEANILNRIIPKSGAVSVDRLKDKFSAFEWMKIPKAPKPDALKAPAHPGE